MKTALQWIVCGLIFFALVCVFALIFGLPVWLLWNWLMPELFGLKTITFLQAVGLLMLCGLLFKSGQSRSD